MGEAQSGILHLVEMADWAGSRRPRPLTGSGLRGRPVFHCVGSATPVQAACAAFGLPPPTGGCLSIRRGGVDPLSWRPSSTAGELHLKRPIRAWTPLRLCPPRQPATRAASLAHGRFPFTAGPPLPRSCPADAQRLDPSAPPAEEPCPARRLRNCRSRSAARPPGHQGSHQRSCVSSPTSLSLDGSGPPVTATSMRHH